MLEKNESRTREDAILSARHTLVAELGIEGSPLAEAFLIQSVGPKLRLSAVRAHLAAFATETLVAAAPSFRAGGYNEANDQIKILVPVRLVLRDDLSAPVFVALVSNFTPFVTDLARRGPAAVAAEMIARQRAAADQLAVNLREKPPTFPGWSLLNQDDIARAFDAAPPVLTDRRDLFSRLKIASAHAADRGVLDVLARGNPGFLDYLQCFPLARSMKRRVVAWLGPTNSGKTHRAIERLREARSGMYLGPLRLLALEQRDRLVELGRPCSLITGEERDETSPTHSARTVETADFHRRIDVCVLDEMQLAFDRDRGWAWVAAYCGVAAETLIVTGPLSTEPMIRRLAEVCGDDIEVHTLERQGALGYEGVIDWRNVPPRTAVIGFSRIMVLELKAMFEARGRSVSVIYGSLSPEVRREEARRFRTGQSDVVCATDAIGLGLNFPIDRVAFYELDKFDGERDRPLTRAEILQIAGRAGRGPGATGLVAAFSARDGRRVAEALREPQKTPSLELLPAAPTPMHVRAIADHLGLDRLSPILEFFRTRLTFPGGTFFPEVQDDVFGAAQLVDDCAPTLPVETRYALACVPIDLEDYLFRSVFAEWLGALATGVTVSFPRRVDTRGGLESLEETIKLVTAYRWLALKFPEAFTDLAHVEFLRRDATEGIQAILRRNWGQQGLSRRECTNCRRALLPSSPHTLCRRCFNGEFG